MPNKPTLLILDGHAILHRAWHGLPPLTTQDGVMTAGAYGFLTTMFRAVRQFQPTHVVATFDLPKPTFRHEAYKEYKAHREKQSDEFYAQVPLIRELLAALEVPVYTAEGFEADDVIATIADQAKAVDSDLQVIIATGDLDSLQLVDERTHVFTMRKGLSDTVVYDPAAVVARFGLTPGQMIDYKALRGDTSDNIPGVRGIGEKTAAELLQQFGTVKDLYAAIDAGETPTIRNSVREKLIAGRADALQAFDLCTIRHNAPVTLSLSDAGYRLPPRDKVKDLFERYEFHRLLTQMPDGERSSEKSPDEKKTKKKEHVEATQAMEFSAAVPAKVVGDSADFAAIVETAKKSRSLCFRSYATSDDAGALLVGLGLAWQGGESFLPLSIIEAETEEITELLADAIDLSCHDLKREINLLLGVGVKVPETAFDMMIAAYLTLAGERKADLASLLAARYGVMESVECGEESTCAARAGAELPHLMRLAAELREEMKSGGYDSLYGELEAPLAPVLARMERRGIAIDREHFLKLSEKFGAEITAIEKRAAEMAGGEFNLNSPKQVKEVLFGRLDIIPPKLKKTAKGKELSTAASELEKMRELHPIVGEILAYRELAKLKSTYVDVMPEIAGRDGRVHASFNQAVTSTGRLSSSNPNLQNIPTSDSEHGRAVRDGFIADDGYVLVALDYSQIELRIAAHLAPEPVMIEAFRAGRDIHRATAAAMFGEAQADETRRIAKTINFGILFGMGSTRLSESAGISTTEAREYIDRYFEVYQGIAAYMEERKRQLEETNCVTTLYGRKRCFPPVVAMNHRERAEAERQAINMPVQGTEADMMKVAMIRVDEWLGREYGHGPDAAARLILQVHDELVFEVKESETEKVIREAKRIMEQVRELVVPVIVDAKTGTRWGSLKKSA